MWGHIILINQYEDITTCIQNGYSVIALTDDVEQFQYTPVLTAGVLLPPYEALSADIDGNIQMSDNIYYQYLMGIDRMNVISTIIAALHMGKNLAFYIPFDESVSFRFAANLVQFFITNFGIYIGDGIGLGFQPAPSLDISPQCEAARLEIIYNFDRMDFNQFCKEYPPNIIPTDICCAKIMQQFNYGFQSTDDCRQYCYQIINQNR